VVNEDSKERWAVLMKFGQRDHLEQLRNAGLVYIDRKAVFISWRPSIQSGAIDSRGLMESFSRTR
jgi:hypothetical protein